MQINCSKMILLRATNAGRLIFSGGFDNQPKSLAISAGYPILSTFRFPPKAARGRRAISLTNGGLFRPDHRKSPQD
jgi:hypothetical protein